MNNHQFYISGEGDLHDLVRKTMYAGVINNLFGDNTLPVNDPEVTQSWHKATPMIHSDIHDTFCSDFHDTFCLDFPDTFCLDFHDTFCLDFHDTFCSDYRICAII